MPLSLTFEQVEIRDRFSINLDEFNLASIRVVQYDKKRIHAKHSMASLEEQY